MAVVLSPYVAVRGINQVTHLPAAPLLALLRRRRPKPRNVRKRAPLTPVMMLIMFRVSARILQNYFRVLF
jgi:hypothetical protein